MKSFMAFFPLIFSFIVFISRVVSSQAAVLPIVFERAPGNTTHDNTDQTFFSYKGGSWNHDSNMGSFVQGGTLSYSADPHAYIAFNTPDGASGLYIYTAKRADRGSFEIYLDDDWAATATAFGRKLEYDNSSVVFSQTSIPPGPHKWILRNTGSHQKLSLDYVIVES